MKIIIPGAPVAQARMRHFRRGGFTGVFDPNGADKKRIRAILSKVDPMQFENPKISFVFYMPTPKQVPKKLLDAYCSERKKHKKKPDVDNLVKLYLDCLDEIFFAGDQRVTLGPCLKVYSPTPRTVILIDEMTENLETADLDHTALDAELFDRPSSVQTGSLLLKLPPFR